MSSRGRMIGTPAIPALLACVLLGPAPALHAQAGSPPMPRDRQPGAAAPAAQHDEEARLKQALASNPADVETLRTLAALYNRTGRFDLAIQSLERVASLRPADAEAHHVVGTYYFEKSRDKTLEAATKQTYIERGIGAEDQALAIDPDYMEALVYKSLFLRVQAQGEPDAARQKALVSQADALRSKALQLQKTRTIADVPAGTVVNVGTAPPPPPPPPPPGASAASEMKWVYARTDYTLASGGAGPTKIKDVRPIYAPMAIASGIQGTVILEATVDPRGRVSQVKVVQSLPVVTQAAIDAVKQWEFDPATVGAEPVVLTVMTWFVPPKG